MQDGNLRHLHKNNYLRWRVKYIQINRILDFMMFDKQ